MYKRKFLILMAFCLLATNFCIRTSEDFTHSQSAQELDLSPEEFIFIYGDTGLQKKTNSLNSIELSEETLTPEEEEFISQYDKPQNDPSRPRKKRNLLPIDPQAEEIALSKNYEKALFSLKDNIKQELIDRITRENKSILLTMYTFTDSEIAEVLIKAKHRGIHIEILVDESQILNLFDMYKICMRFINNNIPVFIYPEDENIPGIMHNKFVLFGNQNSSPLLWTGSFNFTKSANQYNAENVIILNSPNLIHEYQNQFEKLKKQSSKVLPRLHAITCPQCYSDDSLKVNSCFAQNKKIVCQKCTFQHKFIGR